jgi:hypothetical protein
MAFNLNGTHVL